MDSVEEFKSDFDNPEEELTYWKEQSHKLKIIVEESQSELSEFQEFSRELEHELQTQLEAGEKEISNLKRQNVLLSQENETVKEKLESQQHEYQREMNKVQDELAQVTALKNEQASYIREIEQCNDDLERAKRATIVSIEDFDLRLNHLIERNALLESELDEKEMLAVTVQRLRDEARDLSQELTVQQKKTKDAQQTKDIHSPRNVSRTNSTSSTPIRERNASGSLSNGIVSGTPLTPSARISALTIVGELLGKVGALESKLASCRNFVREKPGARTMPMGSPVWEKNNKRLKEEEPNFMNNNVMMT